MKITRASKRVARGFTLIELMIVIVIIAVLVGIGMPAYRDQVVRAARAGAKGEMLEIAMRQKQFLLSNRAYVDQDTLEANGFSLNDKVAKKYTYAIELATSVIPSYTMTFTPIAGTIQEKDGALSVTSEGVKTPADKWER